MPIPIALPIALAAMGAMANSAAQSDANSTNIRLNMMNNEFNERMLDKQLAYNTEMWNKQNEYNSAKNQRKRLEEAGLNPYLMMNGGSAGVAQSAGGINPPTGVPAQVQANTSLGTALGQGVESFLNYKMAKERNDAEVEQIKIENQYRAAKLMAEIADKKMSAKDKASHAAYTDIQASLEPAFKRSATDLNNQMAQSEIVRKELMLTENLLKQKELSTFDDRWNVEKASKVAQTLQYVAQTGLTKQQARSEVYKTLKEAYAAEGQKISNKTAERMADAIVEKAIQETLPAIGKYGRNIGDWSSSRNYGSYPD